jgi:hypothetical protein
VLVLKVKLLPLVLDIADASHHYAWISHHPCVLLLGRE